MIIEMLNKQSANLVKATTSLVEMISESKEENTNGEKVSRIKDLEHEGDSIHTICSPLYYKHL